MCLSGFFTLGSAYRKIVECRWYARSGAKIKCMQISYSEHTANAAHYCNVIRFPHFFRKCTRQTLYTLLYVCVSVCECVSVCVHNSMFSNNNIPFPFAARADRSWHTHPVHKQNYVQTCTYTYVAIIAVHTMVKCTEIGRCSTAAAQHTLQMILRSLLLLPLRQLSRLWIW